MKYYLEIYRHTYIPSGYIITFFHTYVFAFVGQRSTKAVILKDAIPLLRQGLVSLQLTN